MVSLPRGLRRHRACDGAPTGITDNSGIPDAITGLTTIVPFNDLAASSRARAHPGEVAGMILEPT